MFDRGREFSDHTIDQGRLRSYRVATQILGQPPNRQRGDSTGKVLPATTNGLEAAIAPWRRDGDSSGGRDRQPKACSAQLHLIDAANCRSSNSFEERPSFDAAPSVQRGFELEPGFRLRIFSEFGMAQAAAEKFVAGGRLLGLPE
jgi:hypothetical protein